MREVTMNEYDKFVDFMFKNLTPEDIECLKEYILSTLQDNDTELVTSLISFYFI